MKLWGGRFSEEPDQLAFQYNASLSIDWRLAPYDIQGSIAWAHAIAKAGVLTDGEAAEIERGLRLVLAEVNTDTFQFKASDEDAVWRPYPTGSLRTYALARSRCRQNMGGCRAMKVARCTSVRKQSSKRSRSFSGSSSVRILSLAQ